MGLVREWQLYGESLPVQRVLKFSGVNEDPQGVGVRLPQKPRRLKHALYLQRVRLV